MAVVRAGRPHRLRMQAEALLVAVRPVARALVLEICSQMSEERQQPRQQASAAASGRQKMAATLWAASPSGF